MIRGSSRGSVHPRECSVDPREDPCILARIRESSRMILDILECRQKVLADVQSVQFPITNRVASVPIQFGRRFSTFEGRSETFARVQTTLTRMQNCFARIHGTLARMHGSSRGSTDLHEDARIFTRMHGSSRGCTDIHEDPRTFERMHESSRMSVTEVNRRAEGVCYAQLSRALEVW
jgi:hypothetical protein